MSGLVVFIAGHILPQFQMELKHLAHLAYMYAVEIANYNIIYGN